MTKYKCENFGSSLKCALRGLALLYKSQNNFKADVVIALFSIVLATILSFNPIEYIILFLLIFIVLTAEMMNTVIEFMLDAIYKNKYSEIVRIAKDMSAGVVLFTATAAATIGGILFLNKFFIFFRFQPMFI